jgi:hypothetical protein
MLYYRWRGRVGWSACLVFSGLVVLLGVPLFVLIWSTGFIVAKFGLPYAPPLTFLAMRYALSIFCFLIWIRFSRARWPQGRQQWLHLAVTGVLMHAGYLGGVWVAVKGGMGSGLAALVVGLQPVLTALRFMGRLVRGLGDEHKCPGSGWASPGAGWSAGVAAFGAGSGVTLLTLGCTGQAGHHGGHTEASLSQPTDAQRQCHSASAWRDLPPFSETEAIVGTHRLGPWSVRRSRWAAVRCFIC